MKTGIFCDYPGCKAEAICPTSTMCDWYSKGVKGMGWEFKCDGEYKACAKHKFIESNKFKRDIIRQSRDCSNCDGMECDACLTVDEWWDPRQ